MTRIEVVAILVAVVVVAVGNAASQNNQLLSCIRQKLGKDIGDKYKNYLETLRTTEIVRTKEALRKVWEDEGVVKKDSTGQMTIDEVKFSEYAQRMGNNNVGKSMKTCMNKPTAKEMYKEAARGAQCVFEEIKQTCQ